MPRYRNLPSGDRQYLNSKKRKSRTPPPGETILLKGPFHSARTSPKKRPIPLSNIEATPIRRTVLSTTLPEPSPVMRRRMALVTQQAAQQTPPVDWEASVDMEGKRRFVEKVNEHGDFGGTKGPAKKQKTTHTAVGPTEKAGGVDKAPLGRHSAPPSPPAPPQSSPAQGFDWALIYYDEDLLKEYPSSDEDSEAAADEE